MRRAFGTAYEKDGKLIIPVAMVAGHDTLSGMSGGGRTVLGIWAHADGSTMAVRS